MREVVITGMGIVSSLGNNISEVTHSLENLKSGITKNQINAELGLRSQVSGSLIESCIDSWVMLPLMLI